MSSRQEIIDKHENRHKISENQYLDLKFGTSKVFRPGKPILVSDFENVQIDVSYNVVSSQGQRSPQITKEWHKISKYSY